MTTMDSYSEKQCGCGSRLECFPHFYEDMLETAEINDETLHSANESIYDSIIEYINSEKRDIYEIAKYWREISEDARYYIKLDVNNDRYLNIWNLHYLELRGGDGSDIDEGELCLNYAVIETYGCKKLLPILKGYPLRATEIFTCDCDFWEIDDIYHNINCRPKQIEILRTELPHISTDRELAKYLFDKNLVHEFKDALEDKLTLAMIARTCEFCFSINIDTDWNCECKNCKKLKTEYKNKDSLSNDIITNLKCICETVK